MAGGKNVAPVIVDDGPKVTELVDAHVAFKKAIAREAAAKKNLEFARQNHEQAKTEMEESIKLVVAARSRVTAVVENMSAEEIAKLKA